MHGRGGARNRCIGRSGASALPRHGTHPSNCNGSLAPPRPAAHSLECDLASFLCGRWLAALLRSLLALQWALILKLMCLATCGRRNSIGKGSRFLFYRVFASMPVKSVLAFRCASPATPILAWSPGRLRHASPNRYTGARKNVPSHTLPWRRPQLVQCLVALIGFSQLPCPVFAMDLLRQATFEVHSDEPFPTVHTTDDLTQTQPSGKFAYIPGPPPGPRPARPLLQEEPTLGVTVYAPHFIPVFFGLQMPVGTTLDAITAEVFRSCRHPGRGLDKLIPVKRQPHKCALSLLAMPSYLGACTPPCSAVIFDLTCVGGHYHAAIVHSGIRRFQLLEQVQPLIWHDVEEVEVWVDDSAFPASHGALAFTDGSVITVLLAGHGPPLTYSAQDILGADADWGPFDHTPKPRRTIGDAVVSPHEVFCLRWHMLSPFTLEGCVRKSLRLAADSCIRHTLRHMQLDVHGDPCRSVFVEAESGNPWLIDARAVGAPLRVHVGAVPKPAQVLALLPFELPPGFSIVCTQDAAMSDDDLLRVVSVDVIVQDLPAQCHSSTAEDKMPSAGTPALAQAVTSMEHQGLTGFLPQPLRRLGLNPPREVQDHDREPGDSEADSHEAVCKPTFCVLSPDVVPEVTQLTLEFPCSVDNALRELADAIDPERYRFFPRLLEVRPQPSQFWALVVALPPWTQAENIVVFNLTRLDGRCFAAQIANPFRRSHVLEAIGFADDSDVDVFAFLRFRPMEPDQVFEVIEGGSITIRPSGSRHVIQGHALDVMLASSIGWDPEPDLPQPPGGRRACVVHEEAFGFVTADDPDEPLDACVLRVLGLQEACLHVAQGVPELPDVLCKGLPCDTILAYISADAGTLALPEQPRVVILDCRPILQGLTLWVTPNGAIPYWN